jgi:hypothetical protein
MPSEGSCLGVCYADNHLYYSVNSPVKAGFLNHIGSIDFNFDVKNAIISGDEQGYPAVKTALEKLKDQHNCTSVKILSPATEECWTVVPRSVYEHSEEREAHIALLMHGVDREKVETIWHPLSNSDYKLLLLRNSEAMQGFNLLLGSFTQSEYVSEFEIGTDWQNHSLANGSFMMVYCMKDYISAASFILGKLRGCTFLRYENASDLPYLWKLYAEKLSWMNGIHEEVHLYGHHSRIVSESLSSFLDDSGELVVMKSLNEMDVNAKEKTYGFPLESAFPAIMMSLNLDTELTPPV